MDPLLATLVNAFEKQAAIAIRPRLPIPRRRRRMSVTATAGEGAWEKMFQRDSVRLEKFFKWTRRAGLGAGAAGALYMAYQAGKKKGRKKVAGKKTETVKRVAKEIPLEELLQIALAGDKTAGLSRAGRAAFESLMKGKPKPQVKGPVNPFAVGPGEKEKVRVALGNIDKNLRKWLQENL